MSRNLSVALIGILVFAASALAQPASKKKDLKELEQLVEDIRPSSGIFLQVTYNQLLSQRPLPKELVPALTKVMTTEKGYSRTVAAAVLAEITPTDASLVPILQEGLARKEPSSGVAALNALERMGALAKPAMPQVLDALDSGPIEVKIAAVPLAASMGKEAIGPLEKMIEKALTAKNKSQRTNEQAAKALGKIGPEALPTIMRFFDADDPGLDFHAAVAIKSMDKKPPEALQPMLRVFKSKDYKARRMVVDYLIALPPSAAIDDALWFGAEEGDSMTAEKCLTALRTRPTDTKRWVPLLKKKLQRGAGDLDTLRDLHQLEPREAAPFFDQAMLRILGHNQTQSHRIAQLAMLEKQLAPHLPKAYPLLDGPENNFALRVNVLIFLNYLPPEYTKRVYKKVEPHLQSTRPGVKLWAAKALLRTEPKDRTAIAKALAEAVSVPEKLGSSSNIVSGPAEVLDLLRAQGPQAKAALPSLRIAQLGASGHLRAQILLTMAAIDPEQKDDIVAIARKLYASPEEAATGAAVLLSLDAIKQEEALKVLAAGLEGKSRYGILRLLQTVGTKARPLTPQVEALLPGPKQPGSAPIVLTLGKMQGDTKQTLERLVKLAEDEPKLVGNVAIALATFGPEARPALPALLRIAQSTSTQSADMPFALMRIDPHALFRNPDLTPN